MTTYSLNQLLTLAEQAGFTGMNADIAAAIAAAESGGNPLAYNPETAAGTAPGMGSYGLWQIYKTAHPQYSVGYLQNPADNAVAADQVFNAAGGSFSPWSTYKSGAYKPYLAELLGSGATPAPVPAGGGASSGTGGASGTPLGLSLNPADWVNAIKTGFTDATQRIGLVLFGALIILVGLIVLFFAEEQQSGGGQTAEVARTAAEVAA